MTYLVLKLAHIISSAVLFGTGLGIAFFAWFGYRRAVATGDIGLLRGILVLVVRADAAFTAVAALFQPITGAWLWHLVGGSWTHPWLLMVAAAYVFVGACWLPVVVLQIRLRDRALAAPSVAELGDAFHARFRLWFALGWPAFASVLLLFVLMVGRAWLM